MCKPIKALLAITATGFIASNAIAADGTVTVSYTHLTLPTTPYV